MEEIILEIILNNGVAIPAIGFGTWQIPEGDVAYRATLAALKAGYRHIDAALAYGNEKSVGKALKDSGIPREEIFVTTKLPAYIKGYGETEEAFRRSLENLGLDYVDLYLIHAPKPWGEPGDGMEYMEKNIESWRAMEKIYREGKTRAIGVSNFEPKHLEPLLAATDIAPMANQIKIHPGFVPAETINYCREKQIALEGYSPLATGRLLDNATIKEIAAKYDRSVAQICIRWSYQHNYLPLPKSVNEKRIKENLNIFDFELEPEDMARLDALQI